MNKQYGPNTPQIELFLERLRVLSVEEVDAAAARVAARVAAWDAAQVARAAVWATARAAVWATARAAAWAAEAIVVMDLITEEQFTILTEPFAEILVELGIVWVGK
jgi:hypothetical protein